MMNLNDRKTFFRKLRAAALPLLVFAAGSLFTACAMMPGDKTDTAYTPVLVKPPKFLTDVCLTRTGDLWATAEAGGVFRVKDPDTQTEWEDMRTLPGFPATDHCTAVCEDSQGRIWVGTASMGVQVFCGGTWQRYDRDTVLSGSHIHDLASSATGLTAVAHESGVSVYDSRNDTWRDFTALNGLPSGGVRGVCFGPGDTLHCATESGGYVRIDPRESTSNVFTQTAPGTWGRARAAFYPPTETGVGLSTNFCNGISVDCSGLVCIAGLNGISWGRDGEFRYLQGRDLFAKMRDATRRDMLSGNLAAFLLSNLALKESYVNCVHYGRHGLWIGYRTKGFELRDPDAPELPEWLENPPKIDRPVRAFAEFPDGRVFCATYGAGLVGIGRMRPFKMTPAVAETVAPAHPSHTPADPVSVLRALHSVEYDGEPEVWARYLGEDWVTKGDWPGHYGARTQVLCAMNAPMSTRSWDGGVSNAPVTVNGGIGPHRNQGDSRRSWVDWVQADDKRDVLLQMEYGHRTQAEWNDNGEEYSRTFEGPDLWLTLIMDQDAIWRLSLYFFNSNGRIGDNVERDYIIEIYRSSQGENPADCVLKKPLCTARVADFASGGVYKSFVLRGSSCYRVRLVRYGSLNVILNGIFLDHLFEAQDVREIPEEDRIAEQGRYRAPRWYDCGIDELDETGREFSERYFAAERTELGTASMPVLRLAFYRYVRENPPENGNLAERLRWDAALWTDADRTEFDAAMKEYWEEILKEHPERASR